jgi:2-oxoglutarate ferredoxin oxidoreductase subunit delta
MSEDTLSENKMSETTTTTGIKSRGTVTIDVAHCKGCDLCIPACPPGVLAMTTTEVNHMGYPYPQLSPGCTGCGACLYVCPDFVFEVYRFEQPVVTEIAGAAR